MPAGFAATAYPWQVQGWRMLQRSLWEAHCATTRRSLEVMHLWCRQSGKNELAAAWDTTYLVQGGRAVLQKQIERREWEAIHAAPTYSPGLEVHALRLSRFLDDAVGGCWSKAHGRIYRVGNLPASLRLASSNPTAARRGATASAYLRIDEVQHTSREVYNTEFAPMVASTAAPSWYHGTVWTEDSLQHQLEQALLKLTEQDKIPRVLRVPWELVAAHNPRYGEHVEKQIARLTREHPTIQSEYDLISPEGFGWFLRPVHRDKLRGQHQRGKRPIPGKVYIAGLDFTGAAEEPDEHAHDPEWTQKRDNMCCVVGELAWRIMPRSDPRDEPIYDPVILVMDMLLLPGQHPDSTVNKLEEFLRRWRVSCVVGDARGAGDAPSHALGKRLGSIYTGLKSSQTDNTRMGLDLLGAILNQRFSFWHAPEQDLDLELAHFEFRHLRKAAKDGGVFKWGHPERRVDGMVIHDDVPKACGYLMEAARLQGHLTRKKPPGHRVQEEWDEAAGYG
ncbi:MAG: hypothetical protein ACH37Z_12305 [Anaerolineae bacterium]